jgi:hypothetical protein
MILCVLKQKPKNRWLVVFPIVNGHWFSWKEGGIAVRVSLTSVLCAIVTFISSNYTYDGMNSEGSKRSWHLSGSGGPGSMPRSSRLKPSSMPRSGPSRRGPRCWR